MINKAEHKTRCWLCVCVTVGLLAGDHSLPFVTTYIAAIIVILRIKHVTDTPKATGVKCRHGGTLPQPGNTLPDNTMH